jgi:predicted ATPase/class 3 adenylate cyclase
MQEIRLARNANLARGASYEMIMFPHAENKTSVAVISSQHADTLAFLFTDIEGSTSLWEQDAERMRLALARHDALARAAVEDHHGTVVKMTGDGMHAVFRNPLDAVAAALDLQLALADPSATSGIVLKVRCGMHLGIVERRDNDYFGAPVNRAARIMSAAHGGQVLVSQATAELILDRLADGVALRDLGLVRLRGLADPEHVYQMVYPQLRQDFPALRSLEATPHNLPQQGTSFVGREREAEEIAKLLESARLVTLLGPGGIGKTRLSLQVAVDVMDGYPDGVWFVELAALSDERLVAQAMASVVGVKEEMGRPVVEALIKFVSDRQLLLILDNCEHLVHACAELAAQLLRAANKVSILASSREHLNVAGETTYPVPALAIPDADSKIALAALTQYEAVRLFVDRAAMVLPGFVLSEGNANAVIDICRRLDGIPLAIELAAARVRALSVKGIAVRLSDRFRLLTGGHRTALPRQQTLRALIDWSYDLLTEAERILLRRLAVFAGGWTLEAAEAVGAGAGIDQANVLDLLTALVEKSLVAIETSCGRYRLLETVREYAQDRLNDSGGGDATRAQHLAFYLALAEGARPGLKGSEQATWLARLDAERENLLAAHAWCDRAESGGELGLRLVYGAQPYWLRRGVLESGHRAIAEALARPSAQIRNLLRCKALFAAGWLDYYMGRYASARRHLEEDLSIAKEIADEAMVAMVLQPLGMASLGQGDLPKARQYLEEALVLAREQGDKRQIAAALNALAQLTRLQGELERAEPLYENVLAFMRELGDRESIAFALLNLTMVSIGRRNADRAQRSLREASAIADEIGSMPAGQSVLEVSAGLSALTEDWERAAIFFGAAEAQAEKTGLHRDPADEAFLAPLIENAQAALGASAFSAVDAAGRALTYDSAMEKVRAWLEPASRAD